jgi:hypothetical protein
MCTRVPRLAAIRLIKAQINFFLVLKRQLFVPTSRFRLTDMIKTSMLPIYINKMLLGKMKFLVVMTEFLDFNTFWYPDVLFNQTSLLRIYFLSIFETDQVFQISFMRWKNLLLRNTNFFFYTQLHSLIAQIKLSRNYRLVWVRCLYSLWLKAHNSYDGNNQDY